LLAASRSARKFQAFERLTADRGTSSAGTEFDKVRCASNTLAREAEMGRSILLLLLGIPLPIVILLALFWH
jgi:hypothetical protein